MELISRTSNCIENITVYLPGKPVEELERELGLKTTVKLASNENPLGPSPLAVEAIKSGFANLNRYPDGSGFYLKKALSDFHGLHDDCFILGNGTNEILEIIAHAFLDPHDSVVFSEGAFIVYQIVSQLSCCEMNISLMKDFTHDLQDISKRVNEKTKIIFLANPNNPTGTSFDETSLSKLLSEIPKNVLVVVDEAYCHFVTDENYPDTLELMDQYKNLIVLRTFSKVYGLAALRIGYGIAQPDIIGALSKVREPFNVNSLALLAAEHALKDVEHVKKTIALNIEGRDFLIRELSSLGISYVPTQGNFLMVDVSDGNRVYDLLLKRGVIVRPIAGYGFPRHIRVSIGTMDENQKFIKDLKEVL
ncbi:MAG: histidinol-phosphate transaminase [Nitrospinota bacterium]|nr:histidinol-phosphate transaminase [Nitrospinota bacterium]